MLQQTCGRFRANRLQSPGETFARHVFEIAVERISGGYIKVRKRIADLCQLNVAAFGNCERTGKYIRRILEHLIHLIVALYVEPGTLELHPVRILNTFASLN